MKKTTIGLILLLIATLSFSQEITPVYNSKKHQNIRKTGFLTILIGTALNNQYGAGQILDGAIAGISYEHYLSSLFSCSFNIDIWISSSVFGYYSTDFYIHPFGKKTFDPYIGLGLLNGYSEYGEKAIDFPATLGFNIWLSGSTGIKTQAKIFLRGVDLFELNIGFFIGLF